MTILNYRFLLAFFFAFIFSNYALAQPSGARADNFIYKVLKNDTLIDLSEKYTNSSNNWQLIKDLNNVEDPQMLPIGLELSIPFRIIPVSSATAQVINLNGSAKLNSSTLKLDSQIQEGDIIKTGSNSFITIQMPDYSAVMIPSNSTLNIKRLRTFSKTGIIDSILLLDNGQIESVVAPNNTGTGRFEIRTPVSVTGVRGTKLRVRINDDKSLSEVTSGLVQLGLNESDGPNLKQNQGSIFTTDDDGVSSSIHSLPKAPQIIENDDPSQKHLVHFNLVEGAEHYIVTVASDPDGAIVASKNIVYESPASFSIPGAGQWYILIRSVDKNGLHSIDSAIEVDGLNVLKSGFGLPIKSGYTNNILLSF